MAQYYIGESYFLQKKYLLAVEEFKQVLTSYDRSPYIAQTLNKLAEVEDQLNQREDAAKHRQLLTSLFPHAPVTIAQTAQIPSKNTETPKFKLDEPPLLEPLLEVGK
jgi:TolA-binding protein